MRVDWLYFEDVEIGDDIGPEERVIGDEQVWDFVNYSSRGEPPMGRFVDDQAAREEGLPEAVLPGSLNIALLSKFLTDWSTSVTLKKLDVVFRQWVLHNVPYHIKGTITDKNIRDGEPEVECDVFIQKPNGEHLVGGKAIVALPLRNQ